MSAYSRTEILAMIELWKAAERELTFRGSYTVGDKSLTSVDLPDVAKRIAYLEGELRRLENGGAIVLQQGVHVP